MCRQEAVLDSAACCTAGIKSFMQYPKCPEDLHKKGCLRTILLILPVVAKCQRNHAIALLELQTRL